MILSRIDELRIYSKTLWRFLRRFFCLQSEMVLGGGNNVHREPFESFVKEYLHTGKNRNEDRFNDISKMSFFRTGHYWSPEGGSEDFGCVRVNLPDLLTGFYNFLIIPLPPLPPSPFPPSPLPLPPLPPLPNWQLIFYSLHLYPSILCWQWLIPFPSPLKTMSSPKILWPPPPPQAIMMRSYPSYVSDW